MKKLIAAGFLLCLFSLSLFAQNYTIQQYLTIKSAGSPTFSPDGKLLASGGEVTRVGPDRDAAAASTRPR